MAPVPTVQGINYPEPPAVVTVDVISAPDRHQPRKTYRNGKRSDPVIAGKKRTIIAHDGFSFGAPARLQ